MGLHIEGWGWRCQDAHNFKQKPLEIVVVEYSASFGLVLPFAPLGTMGKGPRSSSIVFLFLPVSVPL